MGVETQLLMPCWHLLAAVGCRKGSRYTGCCRGIHMTTHAALLAQADGLPQINGLTNPQPLSCPCGCQHRGECCWLGLGHPGSILGPQGSATPPWGRAGPWYPWGTITTCPCSGTCGPQRAALL